MLLGASEQGRLHLQRKWQLKQTGKGDTEWVTSNRNNHGKKAWYILKLQTSVEEQIPEIYMKGFSEISTTASALSGDKLASILRH